MTHDFRPGDRVFLFEDDELSPTAMVDPGTVLSTSPSGYVVIRWDDETFPPTMLSPVGASLRLKRLSAHPDVRVRQEAAR